MAEKYDRNETNIEEQEKECSLLQILDVGSCHNPLSREYLKEHANVTAIDLCPSCESVFKCDFLRVPILQQGGNNYVITEGEKDDSPSITSFSENSFDVVVFCLLLEYLPSPRLRFKACQKAKQLLKTNGLLLIVTPDSSKNQAKNETQMKSWRLALASIGLLRVYIEKQKHLRCMGYVKVDQQMYGHICLAEEDNIKSKLIGKEAITNLVDYNTHETEPEHDNLFFIPQDRTTKQVLAKERQISAFQASVDEMSPKEVFANEDFLKEFSTW